MNRICARCGRCCQYVGTSIDEPKTKEDFEHVIWFLLHEDVHVYIDQEDDWILEFKAKCRAYENNSCKIHAKRPGICKEHDPSECDGSTPGDNGEKVSFNSVKDFKTYVEETYELPFELEFP